MPDISMCTDKDCPQREKCFRYRAEPNDYQSYSAFKYDGGCDYFYAFDAGDKQVRPMGEIELARKVANK